MSLVWISWECREATFKILPSSITTVPSRVPESTMSPPMLPTTRVMALVSSWRTSSFLARPRYSVGEC